MREIVFRTSGTVRRPSRSIIQQPSDVILSGGLAGLNSILNQPYHSKLDYRICGRIISFDNHGSIQVGQVSAPIYRPPFRTNSVHGSPASASGDRLRGSISSLVCRSFIKKFAGNRSAFTAALQLISYHAHRNYRAEPIICGTSKTSHQTMTGFRAE